MQVFRRADFAGRMTVEGKQRIIAAHATAIVSNTDLGLSTVLNRNVDARRSCIDRVFDQLLHNGRGSFDDLTGRNLVGK